MRDWGAFIGGIGALTGGIAELFLVLKLNRNK